MLILTKSDIESTITMEEAIESIEEGFHSMATSRVGQPPNYSFAIPEYEGRFNLRAAWIPATSILTTKITKSYPQNPTSHGLPAIDGVVLLSELESGKTLAMLEGSYLTALRTGATSGVATKHLAREDAKTVGILGAGYQAEFQAIGICAALDIDSVKIFDIDFDKAAALAGKLSEQLGIEVIATQTAKDAVVGSDVCVTATTAKDPVISAKWIKPGAHINAIGAYVAHKRELDTETVLRSKIFVDSKEHCMNAAGDILIPIQEEKLPPDPINGTLGDVISGKIPGRSHPEEITLFKSVGIGIQDASIAPRIYFQAKKIKLGRIVNLWD